MPKSTNHKPPRTYRIVGPQRQVDERDTPHFRVERGELGQRLLKSRKARASKDPLRRTVGTEARELKGGPHNSFSHLVSQAPEGGVAPDKAPVPDPAALARNLKEVARFFGANVVGITYLDQAYVYSHRGRGREVHGEKAGDPIHLPHKFAICMGFDSDLDLLLTGNSQIADAEYQMSKYRHWAVTTFMLAAYIREMGYPARAHGQGRSEVNPIPLAVNAGLGELGRNGMLIHEEYGSRLHLAVVTTDLPLAVDEPVDIGVEDVCRLCMKCAQTCPTYSIPFGDKVVVNGVEKWAVNVDTCYKGRLGARDQWTNCLICTTSCCYTKRSAWWHTLAAWILKKLPIPLRPLYITPLLLMDDLIWGKRPWKHMKWLDYDNTPVPVTCNIPGCVAKHMPLAEKPLHKVPVPRPRLPAAS